MTIVLVGVPFFKSIAVGWITYYRGSAGPKFTEEQVRMAYNVVTTLDMCSPISDLIDPMTHSEVCQHLNKGKFTEATRDLEIFDQDLDLRKVGCIEALKIGVWLLSTCSPENVRSATFALLACEYHFPNI